MGPMLVSMQPPISDQKSLTAPDAVRDIVLLINTGASVEIGYLMHIFKEVQAVRWSHLVLTGNVQILSFIRRSFY